MLLSSVWKVSDSPWETGSGILYTRVTDQYGTFIAAFDGDDDARDAVESHNMYCELQVRNMLRSIRMAGKSYDDVIEVDDARYNPRELAKLWDIPLRTSLGSWIDNIPQ